MIGVVEVVAQWVRTCWTKRSRGGAAATRRNATPVGFVLPVARCPLVHEVVMDESQDFEPRTSQRDGEPDRETVLLREVDGRVRVELVATKHGMPRRWRRPPAVWISRGEWVRWQINYRFPTSWTGDWRYRLDTLNLAYAPTSTAIFTGEPTRHVDERAHLR
jgi:hypothetical protein